MKSKKSVSLAKLIHFIGIRKREGKIFAFSIGYAALIGLAQSLLKTIPIIIFLTHYTSHALPYVYIISSLVLVAIGLLYSLLEKKLNINQLFLTLLFSIGSLFFILWSFIVLADTRWLYLALLILAQASFDIFDLQLWGVLNRLFTLDQSKRLIGTVGMYQSLAGIVGSLATPLLILTVGAQNSILVVIFITVSAALLLKTIIKIYRIRFDIKADSSKSKLKASPSTSFKFNWRDSYLINNMLFAAASLFTYTIVDYLFLSEGKRVFADQVSFSAFLGILFAVINIFDLINRGIISGLLIKKLGVKIGLLVRSLFVGLTALLIFAIMPFNDDLNLIFSFIILMKVFDEGFSNSIVRQSVLILYQPLPPVIRTSLQSKIELLIIPISTIFAGIVLIFLQRSIGFHPLFLSLLILIIILLTLLVTYYLQKGYIAKLKEMLTKIRLVATKNFVDKSYSKLLMNKMYLGSPSEKIYCLSLLKKIDHKLFEKGLEVALTSQSKLVIHAALHYLVHYKDIKLITKVKHVMLGEVDHNIQAVAFKAFIFQQRAQLDEIIKSFLDSPNLVLHDEAIIAALNYGVNFSNRKKSIEKLSLMINSEDFEERIRATVILGHVNNNLKFINEQLSLMDDISPLVTTAAIAASCQFNDNRVFEKNIILLSHKSYMQACMVALIKSGNNALGVLSIHLTKMLVENNEAKAYLLIKIISASKSEQAKEYLFDCLRRTESRNIKIALIESLEKCRYQPKCLLERNEILALIDSEMEQLSKLSHFYHKMGGSSRYHQLFLTLMKQVKVSKKMIFILFGFIYPRSRIKRIAYYSESHDADKVSYALELLEHTLKKQHKKFLRILDLLSAVELQGELALADFAEIVREILESSYQVSNLLKAVSIYLIVNLKIVELTDLVNTAANDNDKLISETALWALKKLNM